MGTWRDASKITSNTEMPWICGICDIIIQTTFCDHLDKTLWASAEPMQWSLLLTGCPTLPPPRCETNVRSSRSATRRKLECRPSFAFKLRKWMTQLDRLTFVWGMETFFCSILYFGQVAKLSKNAWYACHWKWWEQLSRADAQVISPLLPHLFVAYYNTICYTFHQLTKTIEIPL